MSVDTTCNEGRMHRKTMAHASIAHVRDQAYPCQPGVLCQADGIRPVCRAGQAAGHASRRAGCPGTPAATQKPPETHCSVKVDGIPDEGPADLQSCLRSCRGKSHGFRQLPGPVGISSQLYVRAHCCPHRHKHPCILQGVPPSPHLHEPACLRLLCLLSAGTHGCIAGHRAAGATA